MTKKTTLIIIGIIIVALGIGTFIYFKLANTNGGVATESVFKSFFPFGVNSGTTNSTNTTEEGEGSSVNNENNPGGSTSISKESLKQITNFAVSGATAFIDIRRVTKTVDIQTATEVEITENVPAIRYVESSNGHIHQTSLDTNSKVEISTYTIPAVYEALFDGAGKSVVYRYLNLAGENIQSFFGIIGTSSGEYLPENIITIAADPSGTSFFYIVKNETGGATGIVFNPTGNKTNKILNSPFSEWNAEWPGSNIVYLTTKPSWDTVGSIYSLNTNSGILSKILGGIRGLTTKVSQDGIRILYSSSTTYGPRLAIYNTSTNSTNNLDLNTLADKCVFAFNKIDAYCAVPNTTPGSHNPDLWYQGLESWNDSIYKINTNTGVSTFVIDTNSKNGIDATNLFLDKANNTLFFINKKDSTLWSLDLVR